jgi:tubulin-specific chaperone D
LILIYKLFSFIRANCQNILVRDLIAKLLQRIALVLLRPKLAPWRYSCGHRSLEDNLRPQDEKNISKTEPSNFEQNDEDEMDANIPYDEVEMLIGELLLKIRDRDNMVRWTAAKGVARICARIPLEVRAIYSKM